VVGGLRVWRVLEPIAAKHVGPGCDGLFVHASDRGDLGKALAIEDREDGDEIFELTTD
jgi:hypothetical protein